tara:strand:+ start:136 stop:699 length:564 start_codon:yes stop_codon:yes gene_type:complete
MNKLLICVIGLWLIALTYVQFKTEPELSADANATIIAYVHGDSLRSGMDLVKTLTQDLKVNEEKIDSLLMAEAAPLEQEAQELITYANSGSASENDLLVTQERLHEIEMLFQQLQVESQQMQFSYQQIIQDSINTFLSKVLDDFANENNIDMILNWGLSGEGVLFGKEPYNVTGEVLEKLNATDSVE